MTGTVHGTVSLPPTPQPPRRKRAAAAAKWPLRTGVTSCALALLACSSEPDRNVTWNVSLADAPGAILSFWSGPDTDVYAAGGTLAANGGEGYVWRYDGTSWTQTAVGAPSLWWIHGFGSHDLWAVGERGTIVHFDGNSWSTVETGGAYTLWGVWGPTPNRMWAVGGSVLGGTPGVVREWDGTQWTATPGVDAEGELFFKVWGTGADDVHVVGNRGTAMHWDGQAWSKAKVAPDRLLTVRGRERGDVFAVGGLAEGIVMHRDRAGTWARIDVGAVAGLMGLWTAPEQPVLAVGFQGAMLLGDESGWHRLESVTSRCLHAAWSDGAGTWFAGGGDLFTPGSPRGTILVGHGQPRPAPSGM